MTKTVHLRHMVDDEYRKKVTAECERIATLLLEREIWRTHWNVEIDGCVFKLKVEGYPKYGTPRWKARQDEVDEARREFERETQ